MQGHDAQGVFKRISLATKIIDARAGLAEMTIPRNFYEAVGPYQNAEFEIFGEDDNVVVSTVPIGFEVYNNHAHMIVGDSKPYIDEVDKLLQDILNESNTRLKSVSDESTRILNSITNTADGLDGRLSTAQGSLGSLENLVKLMTTEIQKNGAGVLGRENTWLETNIFAKVIEGLVKGLSISFYGSADPQQNLDNNAFNAKLPAFSLTANYYSGNRLQKNPFTRDEVLVLSFRFSTTTALQFAIMVGSDFGEARTRVINNINATPTYQPWKFTFEWGKKLMDMRPYLTKDFESYFTNGSFPMYQIDGYSVHLRGQVRPKKKIKFTQHDQKIYIARGLPFNAVTSQRFAQAWTKVTPYTLRVEGGDIWMERVYNNDNSLATLDPNQLFTFGTTALITR
ncbi:BppU family phage baseplate upper protein [Weissella minor]|uniref:Uncharacterized protein n=1 Tax=Weissella minor TaxID=1620 RepID=A0A0R2JJV5_9LACO|nr:BppU family phage baseplate upper protein [Weissella minor]KRN77504.1 hypothetical protein IV67_GL001561 [Weissella minor]